MNDKQDAIETLDTDTDAAAGAAAELAAESLPIAAVETLPVLPVRAGDRVKFTPRLTTPRDPLPVYLLRVPSRGDVAEYQRDLVTRCGDYPDDGFLIWALRRAIRDGFDKQDSAALLADLDQVQTVLQGGASADELAEAARRSREIELAVTRRDPRYSALVAARTYYKKMLPLIALQHFLVGWENGPGQFRRVGLTPDLVISAIPDEEFHQISTKILGYLGTVGDLAKN